MSTAIIIEHLQFALKFQAKYFSIAMIFETLQLVFGLKFQGIQIITPEIVWVNTDSALIIMCELRIIMSCVITLL